MEREISTIQIHEYPVKSEWLPDGKVVYSCPIHQCGFQTSFPCEAEDVECRLDAYVEMHDHLKAHSESK
jgi:hypothetical protein